ASGEQPLELGSAIVHETSHPVGTISEMPANRHQDTPRSCMEPVFDLESLLARKRRARRLGDHGADFLMRRAVEDVSDRLSTVQRSFTSAASVLSQNAAAHTMLRQSGKVEDAIRVEADAALLDGDGLVAANEVLPLEPESL